MNTASRIKKFYRLWGGGFVLCVITTLSLLYASETKPRGVVAELAGIEVSQKPDRFTLPLLSCDKDLAYGMAYAISPNGRKFAYASRTNKQQTWGIFDVRNRQGTFVQKNKLNKNRFGILDFVWSPNSTDLFVKLGYVDIGYGQWFKWDPKVKNFDDPEGLYEKLSRLPMEERPDSMHAGPQLDKSQLPPVWDRAGVRYENEDEALKNGLCYQDLQPTAFPAFHCLATRNVLRWKGTDYVVLSDISGDKKTAYILEGTSLVSTMDLAAVPANGLWFIRTSSKQVKAAMHMSSSKLPSNQPSGELDKKWVAVDVGTIETVLATYIVENAVILCFLDNNVKKVVLFDPLKLQQPK